MKTKRLQFISAFLLLFFALPSGIFSRVEARGYPQPSGMSLVSVVVTEARQPSVMASGGTRSAQSGAAAPCLPVVDSSTHILQAPSILNLNQSASCFTLSFGQIFELPVLSLATPKTLPTVVVLRLAAMNLVSRMVTSSLPEQKNAVPLVAAGVLAACVVVIRKIRKTFILPGFFLITRSLAPRMEVLRC